MAELRVTLNLEMDGEPLSISPIIRTITVNQEALEAFAQPADNDGGVAFHQVQGAISPTLQALFATGDQPFNLKFNNAGALAMQAGGIVLIIGANLTAGAATNATLNIPGATAANMKALAGGT